MRSETIENYVKAIYHLSQKEGGVIGNKEISHAIGVMPATVTQTVNKLRALKLVIHEKSYGTRLTTKGQDLALQVVRRHRLWETYLAQELGFRWDEVHEIAEALEHIDNVKLIERISRKLGNPLYDPHGDPIPDEKGEIRSEDFIRLSEVAVGSACEIAGVMEHSGVFLRHLDNSGLGIGTHLKVIDREPFDQSMYIKSGKKEITISGEVCQKLLVKV